MVMKWLQYSGAGKAQLMADVNFLIKLRNMPLLLDSNLWNIAESELYSD